MLLKKEKRVCYIYISLHHTIGFTQITFILFGFQHSKSGTSQRHMLNGVSQNQTFQEKVVSKSVPDAVGTQSSEKPKNHMRPLIDTSETLVSKPLPAAVGPQVSENHDNNISLLIDLSETNWMDTPNPGRCVNYKLSPFSKLIEPIHISIFIVVGQDIPPIEIPLHSVSGQTSIKKSGVEVFQEERNRAQKGAWTTLFERCFLFSWLN